MIPLSSYIKRRNGVPLGHPRSLGNMLKRSLGADSFDVFWLHWNPIWNYYLYRFIYKPLASNIHRYLAITGTFLFSGFIHDMIGLILYKRIVFLFSLWFFIMGIIVIISKHYTIKYSHYPINVIYLINLSIILGSLFLARLF